ncbi:MAG: hypothetical protein WC943_06090 [Elusimicrobiota bacterium]
MDEFAKHIERKYPRPERFEHDPSLLAGQLKEQASPLDWNAVFGGSERVIYIGESHSSGKAVRQVLARRLQELTAAGITHLAIEVPSLEQDGFERFNATGDEGGDRQRLPQTPSGFFQVSACGRDQARGHRHGAEPRPLAPREGPRHGTEPLRHPG